MVYDRQAVEEKRKEKLPYDHYKSIFKDRDPHQVAENTGCIYNEEINELIVKMMDRKYIVKYPTGEILNEDYSEIDNYSLKTLVLRYLMNGKPVAPFHKDITYRDIPGGNVYYRNFHGRCITRLARTFANNLEGFEKACMSIGAEKVPLGDMAYKFEFVNNVFVTFALWRGDAEFSASAQILFDGNVSFYFDAEDLAFVGDVSIGILKHLAAENR
ncbi:hypothetical protein HNQ80_001265 [Anaerosolibacter carboniphilus]|uniref:DUF3786 domain-containing protein n=1 Tax=Anaerosolibacter carboniphilus TaxID=1417629 RepID=A0A841KNZ8_9FIRM|nr:DUF3786 domain-containing protein [Anaerosolibacter carboniphilus]MBB6215176.1 hypothetical protein [Anaerosolibacter carboniphilus]